MQGDFKLHIVDPSIIVAPLANSAIEIQEEKKKEDAAERDHGQVQTRSEKEVSRVDLSGGY